MLIRKCIGKFFDHISDTLDLLEVGLCIGCPFWVSFLFMECLSSYSFNRRAVSRAATIQCLSAASF